MAPIGLVDMLLDMLLAYREGPGTESSRSGRRRRADKLALRAVLCQKLKQWPRVRSQARQAIDGSKAR